MKTPSPSSSLTFLRGATVTLLLSGACSTPPKPPELEALQKLRAESAATEAAKRSSDLVKSADGFMAQSLEEWQDGELDDARKAALLGQIKLKQAIAMSEQEASRKRTAAATADLERSQDELARAQKDLTSLNEQLKLLEKLDEASAERQRLSEQLSTEQQQAVAARAIAEAELAVKTAESVNALNYAAVPFEAARDNLKRARLELSQGLSAGAQKSAEMAKVKADEAANAARPRYEQDLKSAENRAQAEALASEASAISGITARRESRGAIQRLVLPLPAARFFVRRQTTMAPGRGQAELDAIANLLKKYPNYPVQIVGYTDNRGRTGELLALSNARAQSVYQALVTRGADPKRLNAFGQGSSEPLVDNRTASGRAMNNRVEVIFLYQ